LVLFYIIAGMVSTEYAGYITVMGASLLIVINELHGEIE
jgi:hypothetical protein